MKKPRGRGQIIPKGKDKWLIKIFRGRDGKGTRQYFSKTVEGSKTKAQKFLTGKLREQDLGFFVEGARQLFNEHLDGWLNLIQSRVSRQTHESYELLLRCHVRPVIGDMKIADIKQNHIQRICNGMHSAGRSARTVRYVYTVASMAFKKAIELNKIVRNPCEFVELPKLRKKEVKVLSPDQARSFLTYARKDTHGLIVFERCRGCREARRISLAGEPVHRRGSAAGGQGRSGIRDSGNRPRKSRRA